MIAPTVVSDKFFKRNCYALFTERLDINLLQRTEWRDIQEICMDFEHSPYAVYDYPLPTEDREVISLVQTWANSSKFYSAHLIGCTEAIGYVCFHDGTAYDIGFNFKTCYQGHGYAYEAVSALLHMLHNTYQISKFTAGLALQNTPSLKLIEKLGFSLTSTEMRSFRTDANGKDIMCQCGNFEKIM